MCVRIRDERKKNLIKQQTQLNKFFIQIVVSKDIQDNRLSSLLEKNRNVKIILFDLIFRTNNNRD